MSLKKINIAIDGPSGVGKSSIAKKIALNFNYLYVNTGSLYRAIALFCLKHKISAKNERKIVQNLPSDALILDSSGNVWLENQDVSDFLRDDLISKNAAIIAQFPQVRAIVTKILQNFQKSNSGIIMEGRDTTYNIMPDANLKIFLWADATTRAKRRLKQNLSLNLETDFAIILKEIEHRDFLDMNRKTNPLQKTVDSVFIDSTNFSEDEIVAQIAKIVACKTQ
ncbi:(d)CMP kinase [Mycoplasma sp. 'Moose RK']|uniref:(d)CMP kinase n=1 Tax=Mycoplasma sp. 'Moose RK' TaxID=2780095 RepID=UPI0018C25FA7|nr:(d)CMP kinase [Mycoplasma sp. 'Moose RK']MBG0730630.1 (d)CMP kinase [Mycoplasma sp. 'Moose RK']